MQLTHLASPIYTSPNTPDTALWHVYISIVPWCSTKQRKSKKKVGKCANDDYSICGSGKSGYLYSSGTLFS